MKIGKRWMRSAAAGAFAAFGIGLSGAAHASVATATSTSTYYFNGNCVDCAQAANTDTFGVVGTLVLQDYNEGSPIGDDHFVSFSYGGSNLVDAFVVDGDSGITSFAGIFGSLGPAFPDQYDIVLDFGVGLRFSSTSSGDWYLCAPGPGGLLSFDGPCNASNNSDTGLGQWGLAAVPEPGTAALLALGLAAAGCARRRQNGSAWLRNSTSQLQAPGGCASTAM